MYFKSSLQSYNDAFSGDKPISGSFSIKGYFPSHFVLKTILFLRFFYTTTASNSVILISWLSQPWWFNDRLPLIEFNCHLFFHLLPKLHFTHSHNNFLFKGENSIKLQNCSGYGLRCYKLLTIQSFKVGDCGVLQTGRSGFSLFSSLERNRYIYFYQKLVNMLHNNFPANISLRAAERH